MTARTVRRPWRRREWLRVLGYRSCLHNEVSYPAHFGSKESEKPARGESDNKGEKIAARYTDPSNPSRPVPLELRPGTEFEIDIKLEPSVENVQSLCVSGQY